MDADNEIIKLIDSYWKFDNDQQPMSSWHDKQDLLKAVEESLKKIVKPVVIKSVYCDCIKPDPNIDGKGKKYCRWCDRDFEKQ